MPARRLVCFLQQRHAHSTRMTAALQLRREVITMKQRLASGAAIAALVIAAVHAQESPSGGATDQRGSGQSRPPASDSADRTTDASQSRQTSASSTSSAAGQLSDMDRKFVMEAA